MSQSMFDDDKDDQDDDDIRDDVGDQDEEDAYSGADSRRRVMRLPQATTPVADRVASGRQDDGPHYTAPDSRWSRLPLSAPAAHTTLPSEVVRSGNTGRLSAAPPPYVAPEPEPEPERGVPSTRVQVDVGADEVEAPRRGRLSTGHIVAGVVVLILLVVLLFPAFSGSDDATPAAPASPVATAAPEPTAAPVATLADGYVRTPGERDVPMYAFPNNEQSLVGNLPRESDLKVLGFSNNRAWYKLALAKPLDDGTTDVWVWAWRLDASDSLALPEISAP